MTKSALLECFDTVTSAKPATDTAFQSGYEAGYTAAQTEHNADTTRLNADVVQAIADLEYTYAEVRAAVIQSLAPLMNEIAGTVLPGMIGDSYHAHLADVLLRAANKYAVADFAITVHPAQLSPVQIALSRTEYHVKILSDPTLPDYGAWISHAQGDVHVDVTAILAELSEILTAISPVAASPAAPQR